MVQNDQPKHKYTLKSAKLCKGHFTCPKHGLLSGEDILYGIENYVTVKFYSSKCL